MTQFFHTTNNKRQLSVNMLEGNWLAILNGSEKLPNHAV